VTALLCHGLGKVIPSHCRAPKKTEISKKASRAPFATCLARGFALSLPAPAKQDEPTINGAQSKRLPR
jgi:hypothetical protein